MGQAKREEVVNVKIYAKVSSVEKKEIVSEDKDGKRVKKIVYVAKMGEVGGMRLAIKSDEPFKEIAVGSVLSVDMKVAQTKLPMEPSEREPAKEAKA